MNQQLSTLTEALQPASDDAIASGLLKLHRAGLAYPPGIDANAAGRIYSFAMKGIPIEGLKRAIERIVRGEVEGQNMNFIPTPPAFASLARREATALYADRSRIRETLNAIETGRAPSATKDPATIARVRAMVALVKETTEEMNAADRPRPIPYRFWRNKEDPKPEDEPRERTMEERMAEATRGDND